MKRLLDYDPETRISQVFEATEDGFKIHYEQDAGPVIEWNKIAQKMGRDHYAKDPDMWKVADIPIGIQM